MYRVPKIVTARFIRQVIKSRIARNYTYRNFASVRQLFRCHRVQVVAVSYNLFGVLNGAVIKKTDSNEYIAAVGIFSELAKYLRR